ncbi:MAG: flagellar motor protein MotB [Spirochaetota bacterium]|jgi:chemotaxis protein MotB|nr:flagellar motor protein MotB [Spirochaetota bacterium]
MAEKKKSEKKTNTAPEYMLTYGDMVTLILTFFVLLIGDTAADPRQMQLLLSAFNGSLGVFQGGMTLSSGALAEMGQTIESLPSVERGSALARSKNQAQEILKPEIRAKQVRVTEDERGITISLAADTFFAPGSADLNIERGSELLTKVIQLAASLSDNRIAVEGHTDDTPVGGTDVYRNNWELSTARAQSVLNYMAGEGVPSRRLQVVGYAETKPIENNDTPEGRAYNRRVDIVILRN